MNQDASQLGNVPPSEVQSENTGDGAADGPARKRRRFYNASEPLDLPGHEAVAQFLATPDLQREIKTVTDLAKYLNVTRKTIYCWMKDVDVQRRAERLSAPNKIIGKLHIRRETGRIMEKLIEKAKTGDVRAIQACLDLGWPEDKAQERSGLTSRSLDDLIEEQSESMLRNINTVMPTWVTEPPGTPAIQWHDKNLK